MARPKPLKTKFTEMFQTDYPIVAAPMFLVSNAEMVTAVSNAGGIGTFPALNYRPIENYRKALKEMRAKTKGPIGINIIVQSSNKWRDQHLDIAIEEGADLIITSLGSPKEILKRTKGTKVKVFADVIGLEHAKKVADLGADGLIAVGSGAGGHAGDISLFALIPYLKSKISLPLIAAGSISDGSTMLAALSLGADAVYMGTRFIACKESPASQDYKKAIIDSGPERIVNTDRVDGFPGNFIKTPLLEKLGIEPPFVEAVLKQNSKLNRYLSLYRAGKALFGSPEGKASYKNIFSAGHGVGLIQEVLSAEEIIHRTMNGYYNALKDLPR
jgi:nitronate monooxygenase